MNNRKKRLNSWCQCCLKSFSRYKIKLSESIENFFESLGHFVFDHPYPCIILPTLICLLLSSGFYYRNPVLDMEVLYGLPGSRSEIAKHELNRVFPIEKIEYIFVASVNEGELLSKQHLDKLNKFWGQVTKLQVPKSMIDEAVMPGDHEDIEKWIIKENKLSANNSASGLLSDRKEYIGLEDVCIRDAENRCKVTSFLELYPTPHQYGAPLRTTRYPTLINFKNEKAFRIDAMLGGLIIEEKSAVVVVTNATAGVFRLDLDGSPEKTKASLTWEEGLMGFVKHTHMEGLKFYVRTDRSLSDELAESCQLKGEDLLMLICAGFFVFMFTVSMNTSSDNYRSNMFPAAVGVISTLLAYGGGVGLCHLLGLQHVPPSESTPFIILGIGVDDIFVVSNAYALTYVHSQDARTRIGLSLREAGISITLTTATNILAFAVGATSIYYSIRIFCIVTAVGLLAGYLLCLTLVVGVLSIHAKHEAIHRPASLFKDSTMDILQSSITTDQHSSSVAKKDIGHTSIDDHVLMTDDRVPITDDHVPITDDRVPMTDDNVPMIDDHVPMADDHVPITDDSVSITDHRQIRFFLAPERQESKSSEHPESSGVFQSRSTTPSSVKVKDDWNDEDCEIDDNNKELYRTPRANNKGNIELGNIELGIHETDKKEEEEGKKSQTKNSSEQLYRVEKLDSYLVVAERVAKMSEERKMKKKPGSILMGKIKRAIMASNRNNDQSSYEKTDLQLKSEDTEDTEQAQQNNNEGQSEDTETIEDMRRHDDDSVSIRMDRSSMKLYETRLASACEPIDVSSIPRLIEIRGDLIPIDVISFDEPVGTVGRWPRYFFSHYYGMFLINPIVKFLVLGTFLVLFSFSLFGIRHVEAGLKVREITRFGSYLREFYDIREKYFSTYGDECVVFFPNGGNWWDPNVQDKILNLTNSIRQLDHVVFVANGFEDFLTFQQKQRQEKSIRPRIENLENENLDDDRKAEFVLMFREFLKTPRGRAYATTFNVEETLTSWKFYYWMKFQDNTFVAIKWFQAVQGLLQESWNTNLLQGHVFTPLSVMWESDPHIPRSTSLNMVTALLIMGICASLLIPDLRSGLLVLLVIIMIDLDVYVFMWIWDMNLNMLTMVNLILSIGFAVDYTAHITHCFNHCKGNSRNRRVVETLLLMGLPVSEGMLSTYAAIGVLSFSRKYALIVVFRMTTLVMIFAFAHGIMLMPVILSIAGPMEKGNAEIIKTSDGVIVDAFTVDAATGGNMHRSKRSYSSCRLMQLSTCSQHQKQQNLEIFDAHHATSDSKSQNCPNVLSRRRR